jgi:hypothetical protein
MACFGYVFYLPPQADDKDDFKHPKGVMYKTKGGDKKK